MRHLVTTMLLLVAACGADRQPQLELDGSAMGTQFSVKVPVTDDGLDAAALQADVEQLLGMLERQMSTYLLDSEISRFNVSGSTDWQPVSAEFCLGVEETLALSRLTDGAFDITVGPLVNLWGFGPDGGTPEPPSEETIAEARERVGYRHLHTDCLKPALRKDIPRLYLDMSAYAKGYAVDLVADLLDERQIADYMVEIGGELKLKGQNAAGEDWAIAIEDPSADDRRVYTIIRLTDLAVATSGDYRNYFDFNGQRYSHTIDTRSGRPVSHNLASVTVVGRTASYADALATALLVLGPDEGLRFAAAADIPALFLLRGAGSIEERTTPAFAAIRREP